MVRRHARADADGHGGDALIRSEVEEIEGSTYTVTTLGAYAGLQLGIEIAQVVAPAFAAGEAVSVSGLFEQDNDALVQSVAKIVSAADAAQVRKIIGELAKVTQVTTSEGAVAILNDIFDLHFAGEGGAMMRWLAFALRVNFSSFFAGSTSADVVSMDTMKAKLKGSR